MSHYKQYPKETKRVYSYFESRGGEWDEAVWFGLHYIIEKYLRGNVVTEDQKQRVIEEVVQLLSDKYERHLEEGLTEPRYPDILPERGSHESRARRGDEDNQDKLEDFE